MQAKKSGHKKAKSLPEFRPNIDASTEVVEFEESDEHQYQDIMGQQGGSVVDGCGGGGSMFGSSTISIRNELVKHAASAYVQSAPIVANRDPDWIAGVWEKLKKIFVLTSSCWHAHVRIPFHALFRSAIRFLDYFVNTISRAFS